MIRKLFPFLGDYKKNILICVAMASIDVVGTMLMPMCMSKIVDVGVAGRDVAYIGRLGLVMVGLALQKNVLFSGTIRENLLWGDEKAEDGAIAEAAGSAQADEFIRAFPDGYGTELGQGGVNVSGGQKQRLCIARAMLKRPAILLLDDATSAMDTATEARIRESFHERLRGTTVLMVAQRVSSVKAADRIVVLDDGRIAGVGTHDELLRDNKIYREICLSQQEGLAS